MTRFDDRLGNCYELAAKAVVLHYTGWDDEDVADYDAIDFDGASVVHGSIQGGGNPRIGHAWVLLANGDIWEPITERVFSPDAYIAFAKAETIVVIPAADAARLSVTEEHWGPWHDEAHVDCPSPDLCSSL